MGEKDFEDTVNEWDRNRRRTGRKKATCDKRKEKNVRETEYRNWK